MDIKKSSMAAEDGWFYSKIQQTKMLVMCQMFGDLFFILADLAVLF